MIKWQYNLDRDLNHREFFSLAWSKGRSSIKNPSWGLLDRPYGETHMSGGNAGDPWRAFCLGNSFLATALGCFAVFFVYLFKQFGLQISRSAMLENPIVRGEVFLAYPPEHSSLCLSSQNPMMRKANISKVINTAGVRLEDNLFWMNIKVQVLVQESFYFLQTINQQFSAGMDKYEIIGVSDIPDDFQFVLDELIQLIQIHIGKQLRGQVSQWQARRKTFDYVPKKYHEPFVRRPLFEDAQKYAVVNRIKKFSYVQLQNPKSPCVVSGKFKAEALQSFDCSVDTFVFSRRPRIKNKDFIPFGLNGPVDSMMKQPIANRRLMNVATFRIADKKRNVAAVLVGSVFQIFMQAKNVIFEIYLEFGHIILVGLLFFKFRPCVEQVFQGNDFFEHRYG